MARRPYPNPTVSDLKRAGGLGQLGTWRDQIAALDAEYKQTGMELAAHLRGAGCLPPGSPANDPKGWIGKPPGCYEKFRFNQDVWTPLIDSWEKYRLNHEAWYDAPWTGTDIKGYRDRLKQFRDRARAVGFLFAGPEPTAPPDGSFFGGLGKVIKIGIVGALLVGGVFIVYKVLPSGDRERRRELPEPSP